MKLVITELEVRQAVVEYLKTKGYDHRTADEVTLVYRTEGTYDDAREYLDGATIDLDAPKANPVKGKK